MVEYFKIGKFVTAHGVKGELVLKHELGKKTSLKGLHTVFVEERKNSFLPWFIETAKVKNEEEVFIKLEGVSDQGGSPQTHTKGGLVHGSGCKKIFCQIIALSIYWDIQLSIKKPRSAKLWRSLNKHIKCFAGSR